MQLHGSRHRAAPGGAVQLKLPTFSLIWSRMHNAQAGPGAWDVHCQTQQGMAVLSSDDAAEDCCSIAAAAC